MFIRVFVGVLVMLAMLAIGWLQVDRGVERARATVVVDPKQVAESAQSSLLTIEAFTCSGHMAGTGFLVSGDRVLTNRHLVEGTTSAIVAGHKVDSVEIVVVERVGGVDDLAALATPRHADLGSPLELAATDPPIGTEVVLVSASGDRLQWLSGRVHLYATGEAYGASGPVMLLEPSTTFGFSGGPVLDGDGRVVAILRARDDATGLSLAVPASTVRTWLNGNLPEDEATSCMDD